MKKNKVFKSYYEWRRQIESGETDLYFEGYLKEIGLKIPKGTEAVELLDVYVAGKWQRDRKAYKIEQAVEIKKRNVKMIEATEENLCKSLYLINKSAKVSRDTKKENYQFRKFSVVNAAKTRELKLYDLKDSAMSKMIDDGIIQIKGYHRQFDNILLYYINVKTGYSYHKPTAMSVQNLEYLGEIEDVIGKEKSECDINFFEAELLLKTYIKD